jgi:hypothetical protein
MLNLLETGLAATTHLAADDSSAAAGALQYVPVESDGRAAGAALAAGAGGGAGGASAGIGARI